MEPLPAAAAVLLLPSLLLLLCVALPDDGVADDAMPPPNSRPNTVTSSCLSCGILWPDSSPAAAMSCNMHMATWHLGQ